MNISKELYKSFGELPSRRGRGGVYTYIKWQNVADRMNKIFGIHWSSEAIFQNVIKNNVIVRVKVTVQSPETGEYFFQEGFGGAPLDDGSEPGNPFKSAYSKALKDACKKWGVALFKDDNDAIPVTAPQTPSIPPTPEPQTSPTPDPSVKTPPSAPVAPMPETPVATPSLPPGVPPIVEQTVSVQQEAPPIQQDPSTPVVETPPAVPVTPAAGVQPPVNTAPPVQAPPADSAIPATPEVVAPSRPANVSLNPSDRVNAKKMGNTGEQIPAVPAPANSAVSTSPSNNPGEAGINDVQRVAIEGLLDMKGLEYGDTVVKALDLSEGPAPAMESLNHSQAISVIRYINDLYK